MTSSFSNQNLYSMFIENFESQKICNVEEILFALNQFKDTISNKINILEAIIDDDEGDRNMALLIRQRQYINALINMPKSQLSELFFDKETQKEQNVLRWYKED